jgi:hypothetical protein
MDSVVLRSFAIMKRNPQLKNVYLELGSTFAQLHRNPKMLTHFFGQALQLFREDKRKSVVFSSSPG